MNIRQAGQRQRRRAGASRAQPGLPAGGAGWPGCLGRTRAPWRLGTGRADGELAGRWGRPPAPRGGSCSRHNPNPSQPRSGLSPKTPCHPDCPCALARFYSARPPRRTPLTWQLTAATGETVVIESAPNSPALQVGPSSDVRLPGLPATPAAGTGVVPRRRLSTLGRCSPLTAVGPKGDQGVGRHRRDGRGRAPGRRGAGGSHRPRAGPKGDAGSHRGRGRRRASGGARPTGSPRSRRALPARRGPAACKAPQARRGRRGRRGPRATPARRARRAPWPASRPCATAALP